ncbi:hypothetical protein HHK36_031267 [Tetracentron sinense]|uniref:Asparagine synthetase domain-containing protein n=1 Tax=Tetracentron sinense TaxID=13715 RepID=A0A834YB77_TETSI|nr:hypothetical protein HHK36_031267 [Tetracentron sinense]
MVIFGEGPDEIFGGYLYFHKAPNKEELLHENIKALHQYDCLRDNKSISAWSSEARVPFLDKEVINMAMDIDPEWKMIKPNQERIEDWIVRKAFDYEENPYLPKKIPRTIENTREFDDIVPDDEECTGDRLSYLGRLRYGYRISSRLSLM